MLKQSMQSLRGRLIVSAFAFLLIFLGLTGYILDRAFQNSVENALKERLKTHIYALLAAAAEDENNQLTMPSLLQDPEFNRIDSGRYGIITQKDQEIWRSPSAISVTLNLPQNTEVGKYQLSESTWDNEPYYVFSFGIIWEQEDGSETEYAIWVIQNKAPTLAEISGFRNTLWRWLGGIGLVLLLIQSVILRWGLSPLPKLAEDLQKIERGEQEQLSGSYPVELQGVASNLNLLIANERQQRKRYKDTLADLAHSLKTPLTILRGLQTTGKDQNSHEEALLATIDEQVSRMDQIVSYQLQRATNPRISLTSKPVNLAALAAKLIRTLTKAYAEKPVTAEIQIPDTLQFLGDERDLMEVLGNILDNAFKACDNRILISASLSGRQEDSHLVIHVDDDGPGIAPKQRFAILERGVRADSNSPGHGIGLAVAVDIISSYQGQLKIDSNPWGGARFIFTMPGQ